MTLNVSTNTSKLGSNGADGATGASGTSSSRNGGDGGAGGAGQIAGLAYKNKILTGDAGADQVGINLTSWGGTGGGGGSAGNGANAQSVTVFTSGSNFQRFDTTYDLPGNAGLAGASGAGGRGVVSFATVTINLPGGAAALDAINLTGSATGGAGRTGGSGSFGGNGGADLLSTNTVPGPPSFTSTTSVLGSAAGTATAGANGSDGGLASVSFTDIGVTGGRVALTISGTATGAQGGSGGNGGPGMTGDAGSSGADGGDGGNGGAGTSSVTGLTVLADTFLQFQMTLTATGANGNSGGGGGNAGYGQSTLTTLTSGVGPTVTDRIFAANGNGGDGGDGGAATARFTNSTLTGSANADIVQVSLSATGGHGGFGANGGAFVPNASIVSGSSTLNVTGTAAGLHGANGANGTATAALQNVIFDLGDGGDVLTINLQATGPGLNRVLFSGNTLSGGLGLDTLNLGTSVNGGVGAVVNVDLGRVTYGNGTGNTLSGFEIFRTGAAADRFIDGAGDQTYNGGLGADRFEFTFGRAGDDRIEAFAADDVIRLKGFGPALDSFAEVQAAATDTALGVLIQTSGTSSILLLGITEASLNAGDFIF